MNPEDIVVGLVALHGGELIGRTRLQKEAYLLDRCGAEFGLAFEYYHYGPYSFELAGGLNEAQAEGAVEIEERPGRHRVPYAVIKTAEAQPEAIGKLQADRAAELLDRMKYVSDFVLELAATVVFLRDEWDYYGKEKVGPVEETKARKPLKATEERMGKALALLRDLGLWERAAPA